MAGKIEVPTNPILVLNLFSERSLPPNGSDLTTTVSPHSSLQSLIDLDGDGLLDVVALPIKANGEVLDQLGTATRLDVWRGRRGGQGVAISSTPEAWPLPTFDHCCGKVEVIRSETGTVKHVVTSLRAVFSDLNGDGLPDLVVEESDGLLYVAWNQDGAFATPVALGRSGPIERTQSDMFRWLAVEQPPGERPPWLTAPAPGRRR